MRNRNTTLVQVTELVYQKVNVWALKKKTTTTKHYHVSYHTVVYPSVVCRFSTF